MTDLHALIHRMADELDHNRQCLLDDRRVTHPLADKARAALAEPEPEGPTDEELMALAVEVFENPCATDKDYARAVLARWGNRQEILDNSTPQPIPVSERLPGPEDCDAEGRCWWGAPALPSLAPASWRFVSTEDRFGSELYWLPAHALPVPEEVV